MLPPQFLFIDDDGKSMQYSFKKIKFKMFIDMIYIAERGKWFHAGQPRFRELKLKYERQSFNNKMVYVQHIYM